MVLAGLANTRIECSNVELLHINPPSDVSSNLTCGEYLAPFLQYAGGSLKNPAATADCLYCQVDLFRASNMNRSNLLLSSRVYHVKLLAITFYELNRRDTIQRH